MKTNMTVRTQIKSGQHLAFQVQQGRSFYTLACDTGEKLTITAIPNVEGQLSVQCDDLSPLGTFDRVVNVDSVIW